MADDFGELGAKLPEADVSGAKRKRQEDTGTPREYLKVFETLPCQLLNAYGMAKYNRLSDVQVWENMSEPLKTGAKYMTEYASPDQERRGIAINRWLQPVVEFCRYQKTEKVKKQNEYIMKAQVFQELYEEIDKVLPALEYCLAPKKIQQKKKGASMLRSGEQSGSIGEASGAAKTPEQLDTYAEQLFNWLAREQVSRIRMLLQWQGAGGLPFVGSVHHRATVCFKYLGNSKHHEAHKGITLAEWQSAIKVRHSIGTSGIEPGIEPDSVDFAAIG